MRSLSIIFSLSGFCLTVAPSFFVFYERISWRTHSQLMFAGMILWFVFTPIWMNKEKKAETKITE